MEFFAKRKISPISPICVVGENLISECFSMLCSIHCWRNFCHNTKYKPLAKILVSENFVIYVIYIYRHLKIIIIPQSHAAIWQLVTVVCVHVIAVWIARYICQLQENSQSIE